jgi:hypothetical protein
MGNPVSRTCQPPAIMAVSYFAAEWLRTSKDYWLTDGCGFVNAVSVLSDAGAAFHWTPLLNTC